MPVERAAVVIPDDLILGWRGVLGRSSESERVMADLAGRYDEPHRRYHGVSHLVHVVRRVGDLLDGDVGGIAPSEEEAIVLAAWFHDAIYDPRAGDNERRSSDLAAQALHRLGVSQPLIDAVDRLVMATREHRPTCLDEAVLLDADLAVLGAEPSVYDDYVAGVRAEYAHVGEEGWRTGRAQVLVRFLATPVFTTPAAARRNAQAAANLARELAALPI